MTICSRFEKFVASLAPTYISGGKQKMKALWTTLLSLALPLAASATPLKHLGTPEQQLKARTWNQRHASIFSDMTSSAWTPLKPFSEVENTGYVAISGASDFELPALRQAIAQNLPQGVTLIVYVGDQNDVPSLKQVLGRYLGADRLKFLVVPMEFNSDPIWARDSLPFPVYLKGGGFGLVDSIYPQSFEPDSAIASALTLPMVNTGKYFRGGNMLIDSDGNCFSEDVNEVADLGGGAQAFFTNYFGCKSVNLIAQEGGIGDIDERLKFMGGKDVLTDDDAYATQLAAQGYTIHRIPSTGNGMETYMNTLLVNGTIFVPQMGIAADQSALDAYRALGLNPVGVMTKQMADEGDGNIHCVTMNYPVGSFTQSQRGPDFVEFNR
jgi:hypothetical protein